MGGHIGVFMYKDVFAKIGVPHIFGTVKIEPFKFVELTSVALRIIQTEPDQMETYIDQFGDVFDIQYGSDELREPFSKIELVVRYLGLSKLQLHSAAAVLTGGYDHRGAAQSALLATELALKGAAAAQGMTENNIRSEFGHRLGDIASYIARHFQGFDLPRVKRVVEAQPQYVANRYSAVQPPRREVGHLAMGAQYVVSEVVRQMSARNFNASISPPRPRFYPA